MGALEWPQLGGLTSVPHGLSFSNRLSGLILTVEVVNENMHRGELNRQEKLNLRLLQYESRQLEITGDKD